VIGRGLRLMTAVGPDRTQTLEVLGTRNLLNVLRDQLEAEGVGVATRKNKPPRPVIIAPVKERLAYDIAIPITKPCLIHNERQLSALDPAAFAAIYDQEELAETCRINLKMEFATTETEVHQADLAAAGVPMAQALLGSITNKVIQRAKLPAVFAKLYPIVRTYVATRCFGKLVDVDDETVRSRLQRLDLQEGIAKYLARQIAELTIEKRTIEFEKTDFTLSDTKPFSWRRNLPPLLAERTVFNYVATYNDFERRFAQFLDEAPDVLRFASLGTTEQGGREHLSASITSSQAAPLASTTRTGWSCKRQVRARSTGSSKPKAVSGRAPQPRTQQCATGVLASRSKQASAGSTHASTSPLLRHASQLLWKTQHRLDGQICLLDKNECIWRGVPRHMVIGV
jgi:hypothetical protein